MLTRDSQLWNILFIVGLTMAGGLIAGSPDDYGVGPVAFKWMQLLATGFVAAGKMGNSPLRGAVEQRATDRKEAREDARDAQG
jgi:hypothetical protein